VTTRSRDGMWRDCEAFARFLFHSPVGEGAATVMRSSTARLYEDLLLYQEAGDDGAAGWHRDAPHWPLTGHRVTSWSSTPGRFTRHTARCRTGRGGPSRFASWATTSGGGRGGPCTTRGCAIAGCRKATSGITLGSPWWHGLPFSSGGHPSEGLKSGSAAEPIELPRLLLAALASIRLGLVLGPEAPLMGLSTGPGILSVELAKKDASDRVLVLMAAAMACQRGIALPSRFPPAVRLGGPWLRSISPGHRPGHKGPGRPRAGELVPPHGNEHLGPSS